MVLRLNRRPRDSDPERELKPSVIRYISLVLGGFGVQRCKPQARLPRTESNYRPSRGRGPVTESSLAGSGRTLLKFAAGSPLATGMAVAWLGSAYDADPMVTQIRQRTRKFRVDS